MIETLAQIAVVVGTGGTYALFAFREPRIRRWGYVAGLAAEPFWLYTSWMAGQWGVVIVTFVTAAALVIGLRNNWRV